jgi:putative ABC transport system permease protein
MALLISCQYKFLTQKFPGFDKENLLIIRRPDGLKGKLEEFKSDILKIEGVKAVTNTTSLPGSIYPRHPFFVEGQSPENNYSPAMLFTSYGFDSTFRVQLRQGRFFDPSLPSDSSACVLNETAVKFMGIEDPVGKNIHQLATKGIKSPKLNIIGVVKDFHFETFENPIQPLVILLMPGNLEGYLSVRLTGENFSTTLESIQGTWDQYTTAYPFVSYMLDTDLNARYLPVRTTGRIFILLAIIALILSNVALFGLVSFYQARRKREIGVYKLLGASTRNILIRKMLSIVLMVLSASTVAWIGSYLLINRWLQDYAYHTHIHISCFIASFAVVLFTALGTAWYHSWASSRENPRLLLRDP